MGFMDKVKSAAQDAAVQAKAATQQAQTKIEQTQLGRQKDDKAKQLGYAIYKERTEGVAATEAEQLIAEIKELDARIAAEGQAAPQTAQQVSGDAPATPPTNQVSTNASEPTSGDFKL